MHEAGPWENEQAVQSGGGVGLMARTIFTLAYYDDGDYPFSLSTRDLLFLSSSLLVSFPLAPFPGVESSRTLLLVR